MNQQTAKYIIVAGALIVAAGIIVYFFHGAFKWIGKLPGDIRIKKENFSFYFPLTTMVLLSIVLTIVLGIIKKFF